MNNIKYVDDIIVLTNSLDELQHFMVRFQRASDDRGLNFIPNKIKVRLLPV